MSRISPILAALTAALVLSAIVAVWVSTRETSAAFDFEFTVDSTTDAADASPDGVCDDGAGNCTLRAAIEEANSAGGDSLISFNIPGDGPHTIVLNLASTETTQVTSGDADAFSPDWQPLALTPLSGDTDCSGSIAAVDALHVLRGVAGLPVAACGYAGDADCDGGRDAVDALLLLRHVAAIPGAPLPPGCPAIGEPLPSDPTLAGGALATFTVVDETMRVWVTAPATVQALHDLQWGRTAASIIAGPVRTGPGQGAHNAPWSWHLDPDETQLVEVTIEVCDGRPSYVEADVDAWIASVGQFCPWDSALSELVDYTWMTEAAAAP